MKKTDAAAGFTLAMACAAVGFAAHGADVEPGESPVSADFGADLRIRQEIMDNVPGLPGGGLLQSAARGQYKNHMRFRPRVWGELKGGENWRLYARLTDEFRWNVTPYSNKTTFPDELIVDNLFLEAKDLFDGLLDFTAGRQDMYNLYGLDHIFVDGTPGDGSRTVYTDMARFALKFGDDGRLDMFVLHNRDDNPLRWGTERSRHRSLSGVDPRAEPEMDDWGWGGIWSGRAGDALPYQVFAMQKITESYKKGGERVPYTRRELLGVKLMPQLTDELSLQLEAMGQVGRDGDGAWLSGWSGYAGVNWKSAAEDGWRPFASLGFHAMSGDKDAAGERGGRHAWDPMWSRGVNYSEIFLQGTHYGVAWWSNMLYARLSGGVDFGRRHRIEASTGPMFAAAEDGLGGGDGAFKGLLSQIRYDFPLLTADAAKGERFEIFGHLYAELFNPGDYFETDRPAWFLRWQIDFKF